MFIRRKVYMELIADNKRLVELNQELLKDNKEINQLNKEINNTSSSINKMNKELLAENKNLADTVKKLGYLCGLYKKQLLRVKTDENLD